MINADAVTRELLHGSPDARLADASAVPKSSGIRTSSVAFPALPTLRRRALTERQLALLLAAGLFVVGAWPLALTEVPPYQDLPNHLATSTVIEHLSSYPELTFNGYFKTNAALFAWLHLVGKVVGLKLAARLFAALTLAANALMWPRFVLHMTGSRRRMVVASLLAWPMVHHWFVSMGMLDFSVAVPLSFGLLLALDRQRQRPSAASFGLVVALGALTWYAHVFPLLVVHLLVLIEACRKATWQARLAALRAFTVPLAPVTLLALFSIGQQVRDAAGPMAGFMDHQKLLAPWELVYNLWAEWFWAYSNLTLSSVVPCVALGLLGLAGLYRARKRGVEAPPFFSPAALVVLVTLYAFLPYKMTNWFHVNSRLIPYLWMGLMLYLPERLPRALVGALGLSAVLYTAGMGADYVRLDRERQEFVAGMEAVPEGARLLPLLFNHKGASTNTRNLMHMWGYYVVERQTAAPLLFAHSRSFPVTYSAPPPIRFNHLVLESFAPEMATPGLVCKAAARWEGCEALFDTTWRTFWADATPRFDHVLLWDAPPEAVATVPPEYKPVFQRGRLAILARPH